MIHFTLLTNDQVVGGPTSKQLEIFKRRGTKAIITDYAIILGGYVSNKYYFNDSEELKDRTGWYWTKTSYKDNRVYAINPSGESYVSNLHNHYMGIRLAAPYSEILEVAKNKARATDGIIEMNCGYLPIINASNDTQKLLEDLYQAHSLKELEVISITDYKKYHGYKNKIKNQRLFEYDDKKYVRVKANPYYNDLTLSNNRSFKKDNPIWLPLSPVKWWGDEKDGMAVTENIICAGIPFNHKDYYHGNFTETDLYNFIYQYLIKDMNIIPTKPSEEENKNAYVKKR